MREGWIDIPLKNTKEPPKGQDLSGSFSFSEDQRLIRRKQCLNVKGSVTRPGRSVREAQPRA